MIIEILLLLGFVLWFVWAFWFLQSSFEDLVFSRKKKLKGVNNESDNKKLAVYGLAVVHYSVI